MPKTNAEICREYRQKKKINKPKKIPKSSTERVREFRARIKINATSPAKTSCATVEASKLQVCRFCLATNVKMFSLESGLLKTCLETIVGLHENHDVDGLPQYLCYICAAYLLKMYNVIEKSIIAQATLLEIYAENHKISHSLILEQNRQKLNLVHNSQSYNKTPCTEYKYVYDDHQHVSVLVNERGKSDELEDDKTTIEKYHGGDNDSESDLRAKLSNLCRKLEQDIDNEDLLTDTYFRPFTLDDNVLDANDVFNNPTENFSIPQIKSEDYKSLDANIMDASDNSVVQEVKLDSSELAYDDNIKIRESNSVFIRDHDYSCMSAYADTNMLRLTPNTTIEGHDIKLKEEDKYCETLGIEDIPITEIKTSTNVDKETVSKTEGKEIEAQDKDLSTEEQGFDHFYETVELNSGDEVPPVESRAESAAVRGPHTFVGRGRGRRAHRAALAARHTVLLHNDTTRSYTPLTLAFSRRTDK